MNALIYAQSGGGKTVNATLVACTKDKKNLLVCTDNSSIVLNNFERPNLDIVNVGTVKEFQEAYKNGYSSGKYHNIICDNLSDLFDMWILELEASGAYKDMRQAYQLVYQSLKRLSRESAVAGCNTIFTAWSDQMEVTLPTGERIQRLQPKIPGKIIDNICGLMNVVAYVTTADKNGEKVWFYTMQPSPAVLVKDQIGCRPSCMPADIFTPKAK